MKTFSDLSTILDLSLCSTCFTKKGKIEMLRLLILHSFSNKSSIVILIVILAGTNLLGCAGSTTVHRQHHLSLKDSSSVSVYFMRPKEGFMGVAIKPIVIKLDGEKLLDLSVDEYTLLDLKPGKYDMVVTSWTVAGPDNSMTQTSRNFVLDFAKGDSVYLLFTEEEFNFWDTLLQSLAEQILSGTLTIQFGKHVALHISADYEHQPGRGYKVKSVSLKTAIKEASKLEPVEGAQNSPLRK